MGDLVLTESEITPVMTQARLQAASTITALHNHLLRAQPATFYMHVLGHGDAVKLASALHDGLALSKTPLGNAGAERCRLAATANRSRYGDDRSDARRQRSRAGGVYQVGIAPRRG